MSPTTCFPIIIVDRYPAGATSVLATGAESERFEVPENAATQIRFANGRLDVAVVDDLGAWRRDRKVDFLFSLEVVFASMTEFSEETVTFEGIEQVEHSMTNRPVRVTFAARNVGF